MTSKEHEREVSSSLKMLVRSSFVVLFGVVLSKVLTYAYKFIIAREFGPATYGVFTLGTMIITLVFSITGLGLSEGLLRYISLYEEKKKRGLIKHLIEKSVRIVIIAGILTTAGFLIILEFFSNNVGNPGLIDFLKIASFVFVPLALGGIFLSILRANQKIFLYSFNINVVQNVARVIFLIFFIWLGLYTVSVQLSYLFATLCFAIFPYVFVYQYLRDLKRIKDASPQEKRRSFSELWNYSTPLIFFAIANSLYLSIDSFVLGIFTDVRTVGIYGAALTLLSLLGIASELFMQLFFPMVLRAEAEKKQKLVKELSKQVAKWVVVLNLPVFLFIFLFPAAILSALFGSNFVEGAHALQIIVVGSFVASIFIALSNNLLFMRGKPKNILAITIAACVVNLVLNLILVPRFGLVGAATATSSSMIFLCVLSLIEVWRKVHIIPIRRKMALVGMAALLPLTIIWPLSRHISLSLKGLVILALLYGVILYPIALIATRSLDRNDLDVVRSLKKKMISFKGLENHAALARSA